MQGRHRIDGREREPDVEQLGKAFTSGFVLKSQEGSISASEKATPLLHRPQGRFLWSHPQSRENAQRCSSWTAPFHRRAKLSENYWRPARPDQCREGAGQGVGTRSARTSAGQWDSDESVSVFRPGGARPPVSQV